MKNIKISKAAITSEDIQRTLKVLIDNGIDEDEADIVLQAIGYTLLDTELFPEESEAPVKRNRHAVLTLNYKQFFELEGEGDTNLYNAIKAAIADAKTDKVRESIANIPEAYLKSHNLTMRPLPEAVIILDDVPIYGGLAEERGIELVQCCHCEHCEANVCSRYGEIDPNSEPCDHFAGDSCWNLTAIGADGTVEDIALFRCYKFDGDRGTEKCAKKVAEALADSYEDIAETLAALPADSKLYIEKI